ncbi:hypothetical protein JCM16106_16540 [Hydrogenophilus islandicus]
MVEILLRDSLLLSALVLRGDYRYTSRFEEAKSLRDKADVMNWTLNELACSITPNLRLDLIASAQAELVRADTME